MNQARSIVGILIILLGVSFIFNFPVFRIALAILVIWLGIRLLTGSPNQINFNNPSATVEDKIDRVLILSGINQVYKSQNFGGGQVIAIFGGLKLTVPQSWTIRSEGIGILGGFNNNTETKGKQPIEARIKGVAILGGVEVVN